MTEKRRLTHDLAAIKAALASPATLNRTKVATRDASALGMDAAAVVAVPLYLKFTVDDEGKFILTSFKEA